MKEQLITFETAKLAKEKGFENKSPHEYDELKVPQQYGLLESHGLWRISAPTQSLLQKWLREVYKIHIVVYVMEKSTDTTWETYYDFHLKKGHRLGGLEDVHAKGKEFETYEKALEKGLQEALKLIK